MPHSIQSDAPGTRSRRLITLAAVVLCALIFGAFLEYSIHTQYCRLLFGDIIFRRPWGEILLGCSGLESVATAIVRLVTDPEFSRRAVECLISEEDIFRALAGSCGALAAVGGIAAISRGYRTRPMGRSFFRTADPLLLGAVCGVALAWFFLLRFEMEIFDLRRVLQPIKGEAVTEAAQPGPKGSARKTARIVALNRLLTSPEKNALPPAARKWFAPAVSGDADTSPRHLFAASLLAIALTAGAAFAVHETARLVQKEDGSTLPALGRRAVLAVLASQLFMLGPLCGKLANDFTFPVATLVLDDPANPPSHPVFLLAEDEDTLIVYDRLNFFRLTPLPKRRVVRASIMFHAPLFGNCGRVSGTFVPCETLGAPDADVKDL